MCLPNVATGLLLKVLFSYCFLSFVLIFLFSAYETSLFLAVLFNSPRQTSSTVPYLVPNLYLNTSKPHHNCILVILISLLYHMVSEYPSQRTFRQTLALVPPILFPSGQARMWITSLASSLRCRNYFQIERLAHASWLPSLSDDLDTSLDSLSLSPQSSRDLAHRAFRTLVDSLVIKSRATTWAIIRASYRELSCHAGSETRHWLSRSLVLDSHLGDRLDIDRWLEQESISGHIRPKEASDGRWTVCKVV